MSTEDLPDLLSRMCRQNSKSNMQNHALHHGDLIQLVHTSSKLALPWVFRIRQHKNGRNLFSIYGRPMQHLKVGKQGKVQIKGWRGRAAEFRIEGAGEDGDSIFIFSHNSKRYLGFNENKELVMGRAGRGKMGIWTFKKFSKEECQQESQQMRYLRKDFLAKYLHKEISHDDEQDDNYTPLVIDDTPEEEIPFEDENFQVGNSALGEEVANRVECEFRRPQEFSETPSLFKVIEPGDVRQGALGDCWLMSSLAAVAEFPRVIEHMFVHTKTRVDGKYVCRIFDSEQKKFVHLTVDDKIPCRPGGGPIFAESLEGELWPCIIEKAFAKWVGSYSKLSGGWPALALEAITGSKSRLYSFTGDTIMGLSFGNLNVKSASNLTDGASIWYTNESYSAEQFWDKLMMFDESDYLMTLASPGTDVYSEAQGPSDDFGIVGGHAYSLISVVEVSDFKLCKIRNPWGDFEWGGDWSDRSIKWSEHNDVFEELQPKLDKDDGLFWMPYEELIKIFTSVTVNFMTRALAMHKQIKIDENGNPRWVDCESSDEEEE